MEKVKLSKVIDNWFNKKNYADLIGKIYINPPSYAIIQTVEETPDKAVDYKKTSLNELAKFVKKEVRKLVLENELKSVEEELKTLTKTEVYPNSENSIVRWVRVWEKGAQYSLVENPSYNESVTGVPQKWDIDNLANGVANEFNMENYHKEDMDEIDIGIIPNGTTMVNVYKYKYNNGTFELINKKPMIINEETEKKEIPSYQRNTYEGYKKDVEGMVKNLSEICNMIESCTIKQESHIKRLPEVDERKKLAKEAKDFLMDIYKKAKGLKLDTERKIHEIE